MHLIDNRKLNNLSSAFQLSVHMQIYLRWRLLNGSCNEKDTVDIFGSIGHVMPLKSEQF